MSGQRPEIVIQPVPEVPERIQPLPPSTSKEKFLASTLDAVSSRSGFFTVPQWLRYLFIAVTGAAILGAPAAIYRWKSNLLLSLLHRNGAYELVRWSTITLLAWGCFFGSIGVVRIVALLSRARPLLTEEDSGNESELALALKRLDSFVGFTVAACAVWLASTRLFPKNVETRLGILGPLTEQYVLHTTIAIFVFSFLLLVEKIAILRVGHNYHYDYYADRIEENMFCVAAMRRLRRKFMLTPTTKKLFDMATESSSHQDEAAELAVLSFKGLKQDNAEGLVAQDLEVILTPKDAKRFFELIDKDGNGDLTQKEIIDSFQQVYIERENLAQSLTASDDLISRLHGLGMMLVVAVTGALCLPIFQLGLVSSIFSLVAFLTAAKSFLEGTILAIFDTIIFIFVSHPFDVGDTVLLDGQKFNVKRIGWWSSVFYGEGKCVTYLYNSALNGMYITNFRRSGPQAQEFCMDIHMDTSPELLEQLEERLNVFLESNPRDFIAPVTIKIKKIVNSEDLKISLTVQHRSNFQNSNLRGHRNSLFLQAVKTAMAELNINLAKHCH